MNKELIDQLQGSAANIGYYVCVAIGHEWGTFSGLGSDLEYDITGQGEITFWLKGNPKAGLKFKSLLPKNISKSIFHEPRISGTTIGDLNSSKITNDSDNITIERTYSFNEDETTSMHQEAGVDVGIALRQQIGYGGAASPVSGETEITASINAHYNKTWGSESSKGRTISNTISVPPKTEATVSTQKAASDFSQKAEYWCDLDFDIEIWSTSQWTDYHFTVKGLEELKQILSGFGVNTHYLSPRFKNTPMTEELIEYVCKSPSVHLEETIKFSNASSGNVKITERKL